MSHLSMAQNAQRLIASVDPRLGDRNHSIRDRVLRHIRAETGSGGRAEWPDIVKSMQNVIHTAEIRVQSDLVDGLRKSVAALEEHRRKGGRGWEGDLPLQLANLPQHVQLLLSLAEKPSEATHDLARRYLLQQPRTGPTADQLLYREIMSDPFEGDHWGKGWDEEIKKGWTDSESEETSDEEEEVVTPSSRTMADPMAKVRSQLDQRKADSLERLRAAETTLRGLKQNAYWRTGGRDIRQPEERPQGWRALSTGACIPALSIKPGSSSAKLISISQFQRELLFALAGKPGIVFSFDPDGSCRRTQDHPHVAQFSPEALSSIAADSQCRASQVNRLRVFIDEALAPWPLTSGQRRHPRVSGTDSVSRTKQAFAEGTRQFVEDIGHWVAEQESLLVLGRPNDSASPRPTTSPLRLLRSFEQRFGLMLDHLTDFLRHASRPILLLDAIYAAIDNTRVTLNARHLEDLVLLFIRTATPMWGLLGDWLTRGMPISNTITMADSNLIEADTKEPEFDEEFFIHRDRDVAWSDEDFWESAWVDSPDGWPTWLAHGELRSSILEAGKARGLLRTLELETIEWDEWQALPGVLRLEECHSASIADILFGWLRPRCQIAQLALRRALDEECGLLQHLDAIEGILYGVAWEVLQEWSSWLCKQVHQRKKWTDFQILTGTLRDAIESAETGGGWLNPSAIRIRPLRRAEQSTAPEVLGSIRATYSVPFPLSQVFTPTSMDLRADVFAFLLQVRRARDLLQRSRHVANSFAGTGSDESMVTRRLLHRLVWLIDVLWVWLNDRVIAILCLDFRSRLAETSSLGQMIRLELEHTRQVRELCFLHEKTSEMNDSVSTVLEITSKLHDAVITLDEQKRQEQARAPTPVGAYVQGRSRRRMNRRRVSSLETDSSDTDDEDDALVAESQAHDLRNTTTGEEVSFALLSFEQQIACLDEDLSDHVLVLKNGAEDLASPAVLGSESGGRVAEIWEMLAVILDDWK